VVRLEADTDSFLERSAAGIRRAEEAAQAVSGRIDGALAEARKLAEDIRREGAAVSRSVERSGEIGKEIEGHDARLKGNADRLAKLDGDVARFETLFAQMKRVEDDVNARVARFVAEKRRLDAMEDDLARILRTSHSVDEKLAQVTNSDDALQAVQIKIRGLDDAMREADERFQRVERKSETLQETNDGIDRNFKALQESEQTAAKLEAAVFAIRTDVDAVRHSVELLASENARTLEAAEKLSTLDESLNWLGERISDMNKAREMVVGFGRELRELEENTRTHLKMTRSLLKSSQAGTSAPAAGKGAPSIRDRENMIKLRQQGWEIEAIARSMGWTIGEVELVLELPRKDL